jgi:hypothetical protein
MRLVREAPRLVVRMAEHHTWWFVAASIVFWALLSPLALVWFVLWLVDRYRALDKRPEARVARLLRFYPAGWRERYGDEMAELLHETIAEGRGGVRLTFNIAKEGLAERFRLPARRDAIAGVCLGLCWLPLFPQGLAPAVLKLTDAPTQSWFLALHMPGAWQWPVIAGMLWLGLAMLQTGLHLACVRVSLRRG